MEDALRMLMEQRDSLDTRIKAIQNALRTLRATDPLPDPNPPRSGSLASYIERVLASGRAMTVKEITEAVLQAGYVSRNKTLAKSVGALLGKMPGVTRVARGQYRRRR